MKLQSMTGFVLSHRSIGKTIEDNLYNWSKTVVGYAKFLKQPLTLGMFVPVDEYGNVLEEPKICFAGGGIETPEYIKYQQAKERVLFEGWNYISEWYGSHIIAKDSGGKSQICIGDYNTIEHLMHDRYLTLSPTAIKQIGL